MQSVTATLMTCINFVLLFQYCIRQVEEICEQKGEFITCPFGQVITINSVEYGRTRTGNCNPYNVQNLPGCMIQANTNDSDDAEQILNNDIDIHVDEYDYTNNDSYNYKENNPHDHDKDNPFYNDKDNPFYDDTNNNDFYNHEADNTNNDFDHDEIYANNNLDHDEIYANDHSQIYANDHSQIDNNDHNVHKFKQMSPISSQVCHDYLLTGSNGVKSGQLTSSSVFNSGNPSDNHGPDRGKLFSDAIRYSNGTYDMGAWVAATNDQQQYIQVQLNSPSIVRGVATQGRHVNPNDLCCYHHVTRYRVMYSLDCVNFETVKDSSGNDMVFNGNQDQDTVVTHVLPCPVLARCVRINPLDWKGHIALRFDLLGCPAKTSGLGKCPNGWEERPGSNQCYLITDVNNMRTRDDASAQCQLQQGHLVKINSIAERDWLRQKMAYLQRTQGQDHFWTSLSNKPRTDNTGHVWHDSTPIDTYIMPWGQGQPDNSGGQEHCGELWDGDMNDNDCNQHYPYICEKTKFWTPPRNIPKPFTRIPTTRPTTPTTARRTFAPPPTVNPYVRPLLPGSQVINGILYSSGCLGQQTDCSLNPAGDYQSCQGCHKYMTCAPSGVFVRPCPANLVWDDNLKTCNMRSSTCGPVYG